MGYPQPVVKRLETNGGAQLNASEVKADEYDKFNYRPVEIP